MDPGAAAILVCGGAGAEGRTGPVACEYRDRPGPERVGTGSGHCAYGPPGAALKAAGGRGPGASGPSGSAGAAAGSELRPRPPGARFSLCWPRFVPRQRSPSRFIAPGAEWCPGKGKSPLAGTNEKRRCCSAAVAMDKIKRCLFLV